MNIIMRIIIEGVLLIIRAEVGDIEVGYAFRMEGKVVNCVDRYLVLQTAGLYIRSGALRLMLKSFVFQVQVLGFTYIP